MMGKYNNRIRTCQKDPVALSRKQEGSSLTLIKALIGTIKIWILLEPAIIQIQLRFNPEHENKGIVEVLEDVKLPLIKNSPMATDLSLHIIDSLVIFPNKI